MTKEYAKNLQTKLEESMATLIKGELGVNYKCEFSYCLNGNLKFSWKIDEPRANVYYVNIDDIDKEGLAHINYFSYLGEMRVFSCITSILLSFIKDHSSEISKLMWSYAHKNELTDENEEKKNEDKKAEDLQDYVELAKWVKDTCMIHMTSLAEYIAQEISPVVEARVSYGWDTKNKCIIFSWFNRNGPKSRTENVIYSIEKRDFELDNRKICDFVIFQIFKKINQLMLKNRRFLELLNTASFYLIDTIMEKADKLTEKNEKEENN